MKIKKIRYWGFCCILWAGLAARAFSGDNLTDNHLDLSGKFGISTDTLYLNPANPNNYNSIGNSFTSLGFNYWVSRKSEFQLLTFVNFYSEPGTNFSGGSVYENTTAWGLGLGYKYNLREPFKGFFIQLQGQATYAQSNGTQDQYSQSVKTFSETWGVFGGIGFEFFMPFWENLSISANAGYLSTFNDGSTSTQSNPLVSSKNIIQPYNYPEGGIITNGFAVNTISINFYF